MADLSEAVEIQPIDPVRYTRCARASCVVLERREAPTCSGIWLLQSASEPQQTAHSAVDASLMLFVFVQHMFCDFSVVDEGETKLWRNKAK